MEGVGARLGRSSTRYGPTATFSGPVRKWKKIWVPLSNPSSNTTSSNASSGTNNTRSSLYLYKWAPLNNASSTANGETQEPPKKKYRYVPVSLSLSFFLYCCIDGLADASGVLKHPAQQAFIISGILIFTSMHMPHNSLS